MIVDKAPDDYPAEFLQGKKAARQASTRLIGGSPIFQRRSEARAAVMVLIDRNHVLFKRYGPDPTTGSLGSSEAADQWTERVIEEIVPNNRLVVAIVDVNPDLADAFDREAAELLRQHTDDLEKKHLERAITGAAALFPREALTIFESSV